MTEEVRNKWFWTKFWIIAISMLLAVEYINGLGNIVVYHSSKITECKHYSLVKLSLEAALVEVDDLGKIRIYTHSCEIGQPINIQQRTGLIFRNRIFELRENA